MAQIKARIEAGGNRPIIPFPRNYQDLGANRSSTSDTNYSELVGERVIDVQPDMEQWMQQFLQLTVQTTISAVDEDDWLLDGNQALFMLQNNNLIEAAFTTGDMSDLDELVDSQEFKSIFQGIGFDEAYDRYQTMLEEGRA